ncbi:tetratricopeptide repeat protein [Hyphomicrobium sp. 2TAF46]|uniref:tetratricopeptide repeat protein n=1 Tax=Hyphomicrobium sp. 2TAF46 TaxID=3233019 RepID=UPI003F93D4C1
MADNDDSLLREVQEELRREQMQKIWQRYNGLILGAAALIVLAVAGYKFLETRRITAAEAGGAEFTAAESLSDQKKKEEAAKAFQTIAESGPAGYAALAKLQLAGAQVKEGKTADAVATYDSLAKQPGADDLLKNFAQLQAASLRTADADYQEIQNRLTPLIGENAPYDKSARELLGVAAFKAKKFDEARKYLEPLLLDPNASDALQERVKVIMSGIAADEVAANAPPAATPPPAKAAEPAKPAEPAKTEAGADKK